MTSLFSIGDRQSSRVRAALCFSAIGLFNLGLIACAPVTQAQPIASPTATAAANPVVRKLMGQWEIQVLPGKLRALKLIITNDRTAYLWGTQDDQEVLLALNYRLAPNGKRFWVEDAPSDDPARPDLSPLFSQYEHNLLEVTADGQLLLAFGDSENPPNLSKVAVRFKRISDQPTLPTHLKPTSLSAQVQTQALLARESEGQVAMGRMNRAQQAVYLKKGKFTSKIADLGLDSLTSTDYRFAIASTSAQQVVMTATAVRPSLKSFTGMVVVTGSGSTATTQAIICATRMGSIQPPKMAVAIGAQPTCPVEAKWVK